MASRSSAQATGLDDWREATRRIILAVVRGVPEAHVEAGLEVTEELRAEYAEGPVQDWKFLFRFCRKLRALHPEIAEPTQAQFEKSVEAFRRMVVRFFSDTDALVAVDWEDPGAVWAEFVRRWQDVRVPEGQGAFEWACKAADEEPVRLKHTPRLEGHRTLTPQLTRLASIAFHLQLYQDTMPILLPIAKVGKAFGKKGERAKNFGRNLVRLLEEMGLIELVDGSYSPQKRKAKEWWFALGSNDLYYAPRTPSKRPPDTLSLSVIHDSHGKQDS